MFQDHISYDSKEDNNFKLWHGNLKDNQIPCLMDDHQDEKKYLIQPVDLTFQSLVQNDGNTFVDSKTTDDPHCGFNYPNYIPYYPHESYSKSLNTQFKIENQDFDYDYDYQNQYLPCLETDRVLRDRQIQPGNSTQRDHNNSDQYEDYNYKKKNCQNFQDLASQRNISNFNVDITTRNNNNKSNSLPLSSMQDETKNNNVQNHSDNSYLLNINHNNMNNESTQRKSQFLDPMHNINTLGRTSNSSNSASTNLINNYNNQNNTCHTPQNDSNQRNSLTSTNQLNNNAHVSINTNIINNNPNLSISPLRSTLSTKENNNNKKKSNSPINNINNSMNKENNTIIISDEIKIKIKKIFQYYTSSGDKSNLTFLKSQKFHKLMIDADIRDNHLNQKQLDLLYIAENKHKLNMDFETFLQLIYKIAKIKYKSIESEKEALQALLTNNLYPLYYQINKNSINNHELENPINDNCVITGIITKEIDENMIYILKRVGNILYKIYISYFAWEFTNNIPSTSIKQKTENSLYIFLKDFNIMPALVSKNTVTWLLADLLDMQSYKAMKNIKMNIWFIHPNNNEKDIGIYFSFSKFVYLLIKIASAISSSHYIFNNIQPINDAEKMKYLLEKMDISNGMLNFTKNQSQTFNSKTSLMIPKEMIIKANDNIKDQSRNSDGTLIFNNNNNNNNGLSPIKYDDHGLLTQKTFINPRRISQNNIQLTPTNCEKKTLKNISTSPLPPNRIREKSPAGILGPGQVKKQFEGDYPFENNENKGNLRIYEYGVQSPLNQPNFTNDKISDISQNEISGREIRNNENWGNVGNSEDNSEILNSKIVKLQRIFQFYSSYGEPLSINYLKYTKFKKLLKECGIMKQPQSYPKCNNNEDKDGGDILTVPDISFHRMLPTHEAEVIFLQCVIKDNKIQNSNESTNQQFSPPKFKPRRNSEISTSPIRNVGHGNSIANTSRMEFSGFLRAIHMIANKLYPEYEISKAIKFILEKHFLKLDEAIINLTEEKRSPETGPLKLIVEILKDVEMMSFLSLMHKALTDYYKAYSDSKGLINYERFVRFCKDFGIFPEIVTKQKLASFFKALASIYLTSHFQEIEKNNNGNLPISRELTSRVHEEEKIDQNLFLEALILCAFEIPFANPEPSSIQKICYLLERMNVSEGVSKVRKNFGVTRSASGGSWDLLYYIKRKYPQVFAKSHESEKNNAHFEQVVFDMLAQFSKIYDPIHAKKYMYI